jgi:hypothetical protein
MVDEILVCNQLRGRCVSAVCLLGRVEEVRFPPSDIPRCEDVGSARQRKARLLNADTPLVIVVKPDPEVAAATVSSQHSCGCLTY